MSATYRAARRIHALPSITNRDEVAGIIDAEFSGLIAACDALLDCGPDHLFDKVAALELELAKVKGE